MRLVCLLLLLGLELLAQLGLLLPLHELEVHEALRERWRRCAGLLLSSHDDEDDDVAQASEQASNNRRHCCSYREYHALLSRIRFDAIVLDCIALDWIRVRERVYCYELCRGGIHNIWLECHLLLPQVADDQHRGIERNEAPKVRRLRDVHDARLLRPLLAVEHESGT